MRNKSILIISERFYPEDFGINDLALAWKNKGYEVGVLTQVPSYPFDKIHKGYKNKFFQNEVWNNIKIFRILTLLGYNRNVMLKSLSYLNFSLLASFFSLFLGKKYDNVFVYHNGSLTQALPALLINKIFKKKLFYLDI